MQILKLSLRLLWRVYFCVLFTVLLIITYPLFYFFLHKEASYPSAVKLKKTFVKILFMLSRVRCSVKRESEIDSKGVYIFCSNHTSYIDILVFYHIIPNMILFMGKSELVNVPLFSIFFKKMHIAVDRSSKTSAHKAYLRAKEELEKGRSLVIFPEGGIFPEAPALQKFKNGVFRLGIESGIPIVPVTFYNNWKIFPHGKLLKYYGGPGVSRALIHKPVETNEMTEKDFLNLRSLVFSKINVALKKYEDR